MKDNYFGRPLIGGLLITAFLDTALVLVFRATGWPWYGSHLASFTAAVVLTLLLGRLVRGPRQRPRDGAGVITADLVVFFCVLFLRGGLLATLVDVLGAPFPLAAGCVAFFSATAFFWGCRIWSSDDPGGAQEKAVGRRWRVGSVVLYVVLLRLLFSGPFELLHEEAYYWLFSRFPDIGYLDHPPMVGWLIRFFTSLLGQSEFAVRAGAFACWLVAAGIRGPAVPGRGG